MAKTLMADAPIDVKKPLAEIVDRMNRAYQRVQEAAKELNSVIEDAQAHLPPPEVHEERQLGSVLVCANPECQKNYTERRARNTPMHGFCSAKCFSKDVVR